MRRLSLLVVLVLCAGCGGEKGHTIADMEWQSEVLDSKQVVVVDFWAPWCGPCREMTPVVERLAREYKVVKVDFDANPRLVQRYGIRGIPTFLAIKDGEVVGQHTGMIGEAQLRQKLQLKPK